MRSPSLVNRGPLLRVGQVQPGGQVAKLFQRRTPQRAADQPDRSERLDAW